MIVRILLEELAIPYETVLVDRGTVDQKSDAYLRLNPNGLIPVCIIDEKPTFETAAICLHLADAYNRFTVSVGEESRPEFLKWLFYLSNSVHSELRLRFYPDQYVGAAEHAEFNRLTMQRINQKTGILNNAYQQSETTYLFGEDPTIVDIYLAVCTRWLQLYPLQGRGEFQIAQYSGVFNMIRHLEQRRAVIKACSMEGIAGTVFSAPEDAQPSEGVAL